MAWNKEYECMPVDKLQQFQLKKLKETIDWISKKVSFYKNKLKDTGIKAGNINSLEDVAKLPFTSKMI